jgi:hypothetical protein
MTQRYSPLIPSDVLSDPSRLLQDPGPGRVELKTLQGDPTSDVAFAKPDPYAAQHDIDYNVGACTLASFHIAPNLAQ